MQGPDPVYINNCFPTPPSPAARDAQLSAQLWQVTMDTLARKLGHELQL